MGSFGAKQHQQTNELQLIKSIVLQLKDTKEIETFGVPFFIKNMYMYWVLCVKEYIGKYYESY